MKPRRFSRAALVVAACIICCRVEGAIAPFAVYLEFDQEQTPLALKAMQKEVARIFAPAALEPVWRTPATRRTGEDFPRLLFVHLHGTCAATAPRTRDDHFGLASTAVAQGRVLPFTNIQCSELRRFLEDVLTVSPDPEMLFERALGRVLAHEAFHFLAATTTHGASGVERSAYRIRDLTAPELNFDVTELERLRMGSSSDNHRGTAIAQSRP